MLHAGAWLDETAFILGGGFTLTAEIAERVRGRKTIVLNSTSRLAPWASVLMFADWPWFREHRPIVDNWPGDVLTISRRAARVLPDKVQLVPPPITRTDKLSVGHHAVDVAMWLGVKRIVLLGFDCRLVDGQSHNHQDYSNSHEVLYTTWLLPAWADYPERARKRRVEIVNATPGSAIAVFPQISLDRVLGDDTESCPETNSAPAIGVAGAGNSDQFGLLTDRPLAGPVTSTPTEGAA